MTFKMCTVFTLVAVTWIPVLMFLSLLDAFIPMDKIVKYAESVIVRVFQWANKPSLSDKVEELRAELDVLQEKCLKAIEEDERLARSPVPEEEEI